MKKKHPILVWTPEGRWLKRKKLSKKFKESLIDKNCFRCDVKADADSVVISVANFMIDGDEYDNYATHGLLLCVHCATEFWRLNQNWRSELWNNKLISNSIFTREPGV